MLVSFFGHQSWLVQQGDTSVLVDPLLKTNFGASKNSICTIFPFREINIDKLPQINAIFLSHEHADHFCLETLSMLDRSIPIVVGPLMVKSVISSCENLGFEVHIMRPRKTMIIGDLAIRSYHASKETPYWENRVYQFLFYNKLNVSEAFFLAVDAGLSEKYLSEVKSGAFGKPALIALSNNSQLEDYGERTAFEHCLLSEKLNPKKNGFPLLSVYKSLVVDCLKGLTVDNIVICGGGFIKGSKDLSRYTSPKQVSAKVSFEGLYLSSPGESYLIQGDQVKKVKNLDCVTPISADKFLANFVNIDSRPINKNSKFYPYLTSESGKSKNLLSETILEIFHCFRVSNIGVKFFNSCIESGEEPTVDIEFVDSDKNVKINFRLDSCNGEVTKTTIKEKDSTQGVRFFLNDFLAVLDGRIELWDLSGGSIETWYIGNDFESFLPFLYSYFSDQVRHDLATKRLNMKEGIV